MATNRVVLICLRHEGQANSSLLLFFENISRRFVFTSHDVFQYSLCLHESNEGGTCHAKREYIQVHL